jgi:hypothetical protein
MAKCEILPKMAENSRTNFTQYSPLKDIFKKIVAEAEFGHPNPE